MNPFRALWYEGTGFAWKDSAWWEIILLTWFGAVIGFWWYFLLHPLLLEAIRTV